MSSSFSVLLTNYVAKSLHKSVPDNPRMQFELSDGGSSSSSCSSDKIIINRDDEIEESSVEAQDDDGLVSK